MAEEATTFDADEENGDNSVATTTLVVGEHSAYKSVADLIEGKRKADEYIAKLTADLKTATAEIEELRKSTTIANELKQIRENKMDTENTKTLELPADAIKQIALDAMQEENKKTLAESNLANCRQAVASQSGDVDLALKTKANELGCSVEYLENIAKESPKAFKSMFGIKEGVTFDSINYLQSSRQIDNDSLQNESDGFFKNKEALKSPAKVAEFMEKAMKNPSILNNVKW